MSDQFLVHPIILELYVLRNDLFYLEKDLDGYGEEQDWPTDSYEVVLEASERYYQIRDEASILLGSREYVDRQLLILDRLCGDA